jgi:hypothetical protein
VMDTVIHTGFASALHVAHQQHTSGVFRAKKSSQNQQ